MEIVNSFCCLIDDISFMLISKHIFSNKGVQVDVHEFKKNVDVPLVARPDYLLQFNDVRVLELLQEHYFSVGSLSICRVLKCIEVLLQGKRTVSSAIHDLPDNSVCSAPYFFCYLETLGDVSFDFLVI